MQKIITGLLAQAVQELAGYNCGEEDHFDQMAGENGGEPLNGNYDEDAAPGHIYHSIYALKQAFPVTIHKLMGDDNLCQHLTNLIAYNASEDSKSFDEMFGTDDSSNLPTDEVMSFTSGIQRENGSINAFDHIYQVIRYVESELAAAVLKRSVIELGDAIEEGDPEQIANLWLGIKKSMSL